MTDIITVTGLVATVPRHLVTSEGLPITSFRLASTQRRFDRVKNGWADGETNWYTITAFRQLAINAADSIKKGERIVATGRLRIREWESGDKVGTTIDVEADAIGHDLSWGSSSFSRTVASTALKPEADAAQTGEGAGGSAAGSAADADADAAAVAPKPGTEAVAKWAQPADAAVVPVPF